MRTIALVAALVVVALGAAGCRELPGLLGGGHGPDCADVFGAAGCRPGLLGGRPGRDCVVVVPKGKQERLGPGLREPPPDVGPRGGGLPCDPILPGGPGELSP